LKKEDVRVLGGGAYYQGKYYKLKVNIVKVEKIK